MESRVIVHRRIPKWRRTKRLTSLLGAGAMLAALGSGSVFAANPTHAAAEPMHERDKLIVWASEVGFAIDIDETGAPEESEEPADVEDPAAVEDPADVEDPTTDPGTCAPDIEEPPGDPSDIEIPGVTDPDDMGDPPNPVDCVKAPVEDAPTCGATTEGEVPDPIENPGEAADADDLPDVGETEPGADVEEPAEDPADVELADVPADPDDAGDPADPADSEAIYCTYSGETVELGAVETTAGGGEPEGADAPGSHNDHANADDGTTAGTDFGLPSTDADPVLSQARVDLGTVALLIVALGGIAWGASRPSEDSRRR